MKTLIQETLIEIGQMKDYDKITIQDICNYACIEKEDFKSYYQEVFDVILEIDDVMLQKIKQRLPHDNTYFLDEYMMIYLSFLKEHEDYYRMMVRGDGLKEDETGYISLFQHFTEPFQMNSEHIFDEFQRQATPIIKQWINHGFIEDEKEIIQKMISQRGCNEIK